MGNVSSSNGLDKLIPKLRFPQFQGEWVEKSLSELLDFQNGINADSSQYGHGIKYISVMDILNNDYITYSNIRGMVNIDEKTLNHYSVEYGDIVFQRSSETMEDVGNTNVYLDKEKVATFGGFVIRGKKKSDYEPFFLKNLLCSPPSRKKIVRMGAGSQHFNIGQDSLSKIVIPLPSITEQQKISSFLSLLDKRITKQRELVESLKAYKRGVFKNIFSSISQFRKLQDISGYLTSDMSLESIGNKSSGNFPVYDASGISLYISDYRIESDYIAIIKDGSGVGRLQYCNGKSSFIGTLGGIVANGCSVAYLYAAMQMIDFRQFVTGATIPHIYYKDYKNIAIPFPDFETQRKIERVSELLDRDIVIADEKLCLLNKLREGLLQQLFI